MFDLTVKEARIIASYLIVMRELNAEEKYLLERLIAFEKDKKQV